MPPARVTFPPAVEAVLASSSLSGPGTAFAIYLAQLEKACLILGLGAGWGTKAVIAASHGLAKEGDESFRPRPAISKQQILQVEDTGGWRHWFAFISVISWAFSPRVHPGCMPLTRQRAREDLLSGWPL